MDAPAEDRALMRRALALARRGEFSTHPNPRVGCVIARGDEVLGEGFHERAGEPHAEVNALRQAGAGARGATVYVTLEPCCHHGRTGPCTEALIDAGVDRVVCAMEDPNPAVAGGGLRRLAEAGVQVTSGLLTREARDINPGFVSRWSRGRPWLRAKLAMSLDGRTALAHGESRWITSPASRSDVQRYRAMSDVIITGVQTVIADDPALTVRPDELPEEDRDRPLPAGQPLRVIMDSHGRTPEDARILNTGPVLIAGIAAPRPADVPGLPGSVTRIGLPGDANGRPRPEALLEHLGARGCNEAWLETGATLAGAFMAAGLIDELVLYVAPCVLGPDARGLLDLPPPADMGSRTRLEFVDVTRIGPDLRILARPVTSAPP